MADVPAPRITVILPTFNRAAYLAAAIESVLGQTAPIHDILIVDDGSTDGTRDVVSAYLPRVRYLHQPNGGKIAAIERGLGETSGDLVWIMDDDDIAFPNALAALAEPLLREPHLVFSYGHLVQFTTDPDGTMVEGARSHYPTDDPRPFLLKFMEDGFITGQPCVLARRTALEAIFPFDRTITASVDYCLNLDMGLLGPAAFVDETVLLQRQHAGARGPLANRYEESERADRWKRSDQILIGRLLGKMPLDAFVPYSTESRTPTSLDRRAALVQRAAIASRKQIWTGAPADLAEAFSIAPNERLTALELHILSGVLGCRYGIEEVYADPRILDRLRRICKTRSAEVGVPGQLGRPLLRSMRVAIRLQDPVRFRAAFLAWLRLMNLRAGTLVALAVIARLLRRSFRQQASSKSSRQIGPVRPVRDRAPLGTG